MRKWAWAFACAVVAWPGAARAGQELDPSPDPWMVPAEASARENPLTASAELLVEARQLWGRHCETCHGSEGRGDGPSARLHAERHGQKPRNLTKTAVQENLSDGDIFWRVTYGIIEEDNIIMPAYGDKLPADQQRWKLVLMVRELGRAARKSDD